MAVTIEIPEYRGSILNMGQDDIAQEILDKDKTRKNKLKDKPRKMKNKRFCQDSCSKRIALIDKI